ncbi:MAG TPA: hypothetical protein VF114_07700 [Candidatus Limnocylindria bacterium]
MTASAGSVINTPQPQSRTISPAALAEALHAHHPTSIAVTLPHDRRQVSVQGYVRHETPWQDELPAGFGIVPNKPAYTQDGAAYYPELLIVRLLEAGGWDAAWRKTWNGEAYWRALREPVDVPEAVLSVIGQVSAHAGHSGQWDILAWRGRQLRLLSSRPAGGQLVGAYQAEWLSVALRMGMPLAWFAVVEHRVAPPPRRRRLERIQPKPS